MVADVSHSLVRDTSTSLIDCELPAFRELSARNIQGTTTLNQIGLLEEFTSSKPTLSVTI